MRYRRSSEKARAPWVRGSERDFSWGHVPCSLWTLFYGESEGMCSRTLLSLVGADDEFHNKSAHVVLLPLVGLLCKFIILLSLVGAPFVGASGSAGWVFSVLGAGGCCPITRGLGFGRAYNTPRVFLPHHGRGACLPFNYLTSGRRPCRRTRVAFRDGGGGIET